MVTRKDKKNRSEEEEKLSPVQRKALKEKAEACIDAFLQTVGYEDPSKQTDEEGIRHMTLGSADGLAFVQEINDEVMFHAVAEVMQLPSDKDLIVPLMRELLEMNTYIWGPPRLCIRNNAVFAAITEPVQTMAEEDYVEYIHSVMALADLVDNKLKEKYAGTTKKRKNN